MAKIPTRFTSTSGCPRYERRMQIAMHVPGPAAAFVAVMMSSCSFTPTPRPDLTSLPVSWKNNAGFPIAPPDGDLSRWWRQFHDPVLTQLIADGLANSPDTASAAAKVREARARRDEYAVSLSPSLGYSAGSNSQVSKTEGSARSSGTSYSAGLDTSWEVDLFGRNRSTLEAATADLGAAEESRNSVRAALAAEIAAAYTGLRADEERLAVLKRTISSREETAKIAGWRRDAGEADSLEADQASSSLESARAGVPALQQSIGQARNRLARLCGRAPGELDGMLSNGGSIPNPASKLAVGIPADTIRQRPDVRLAGYQLLAAGARTRAAEADRYPSLSLSGTLGVNTLSGSKLFSPETAAASVISGLSGPIFDAGRIRANIVAQDAATEQAVQTYRSAVLTGLSEVEDALIACRRTGERINSLETAATAARGAAELARQRYEAGVTDLLTVLDAERTSLGLEDSLLSARADRANSHVELYKALGGGW